MSDVTRDKLHVPSMYGSTVVDGMTVRVGTGVVIRDAQEFILLEKRRDCGWWGLPGGRVEPGESIAKAAIREVAEETGLSVEITHLIGVYSTPEGRIVTYPDNGDVVQLIDVILGARVVSGTLRCSTESEELRYFSADHLPDRIVPPARQPILDALHGLNGMLR